MHTAMQFNNFLIFYTFFSIVFSFKNVIKNEQESQLKMTKLKQGNRQDKQAIHQVQYFHRFAYFVAGIQNTKQGQIRERPEMLCTAQG